jgi:ribonucleotide reductase, class II
LAEIHLNQIDPLNIQEQSDAFRSGSIIAAALLHHKFAIDRYQKSRELDPIIGVSFTGLFDFFVKAFGADWLRWWECDRRQDFWIQGKLDSRLESIYTTFYECSMFYNFTQSRLEYYEANGGYLVGRLFADFEMNYLKLWKETVQDAVWDYCDRHNLKRPNRYTTVQPSGSKSLLTGASAGWHPPKATRYIRRITFAKNDPIALACLDAGYSVIPAQSDKDENGILLNDPFDPRCTEWLVEIPVAMPWADLEGCDRVDISKFSAVAQFDFYMQVQRYYTTHNTSATIELREGEVEALSKKIHYAIDKDLGYISSALLARFDDHQAFPRLPFEPISKEAYEQMVLDVKARRKDDFLGALGHRDFMASNLLEEGPAACDSDKCLM